MVSKPKLLGHDFDNDDITCQCGITLQDFRLEPEYCTLSNIKYTRRPKEGDMPLVALRKALGIPNHIVASHCGVSEETARRALTQQVGGRGLTAITTADSVRRFVVDLEGKRREDNPTRTPKK